MAGVNKRPQRFGTDWSRYTQISELVSFAPSVITTYETAYSIIGEGYLSNFVASNSSISSDQYRFKVIVDGIVVFAGTQTTSTVCALVQESNILVDDTDDLRILNATGINFRQVSSDWNFVEYPNTDDTQVQALSIISTPIFFKSSLVIQAWKSASSTAKIRIAGGYIA